MNILIFNKDIPAGVSTILKNIIRFSSESTLSYKLVLYKFEHEFHSRIKDNWCENVVRLTLSKNDNLYYTLEELRKQVTKDSIIVANDVPELRMAALLKLKNPLVYIIHGDFETYYRHCEIFQDYMDVIIAYSSHIVQKLKKRLKEENLEKIKLIYYPVPHIDPRTKHYSSIRLIFAGSLIKRKGVDLLPKIVEQLDRLKLNYQFTIVGSGEAEDYLKTKFRGHKNVSLVGQKSNDEVIALFQKSDILLFPTRSEGLPNVLVEAMKAGCVPVVSNIESGIPDVVTHEQNGYLIQPDDVSGFVEAISGLHNAPHSLKKMQGNAIETANQMFDPHKNASAYYEVFIDTPFKSSTPKISVPTGPVLNQRFLPNLLVRFIRKLNINPNL